ncbi:MAG: acyltransferase [Epsilonproteobacteria bacterium]|nr:acyltransferase [Campylobacterota bacterium]
MKLDKLVKIIRYIAGVPKSIYVNFRVLPFSQAIRLPIIVSTQTKLVSLKGKVNLDKIKTGIVRIGFTGADTIDYDYNRTILRLDGTLNIKGKTKIAKSSKLIIQGELTLGNNFITTGDTTIICAKKITIGDDTMLAWQSIVMDTDQHNILDQHQNIINENKEVNIGNNVWIGARCFILKGVNIPNGSIIGANTTITKSFNQENSILAGNPTKVIKESISWQP